MSSNLLLQDDNDISLEKGVPLDPLTDNRDNITALADDNSVEKPEKNIFEVGFCIK